MTIITKSFELLKGGKRAQIGEIRTWNGKKWQKTAKNKWVKVKEGEQNKIKLPDNGDIMQATRKYFNEHVDRIFSSGANNAKNIVSSKISEIYKQLGIKYRIPVVLKEKIEAQIKKELLDFINEHKNFLQSRKEQQLKKLKDDTGIIFYEKESSVNRNDPIKVFYSQSFNGEQYNITLIQNTGNGKFVLKDYDKSGNPFYENGRVIYDLDQLIVSIKKIEESLKKDILQKKKIEKEIATLEFNNPQTYLSLSKFFENDKKEFIYNNFIETKNGTYATDGRILAWEENKNRGQDFSSFAHRNKELYDPEKKILDVEQVIPSDEKVSEIINIQAGQLAQIAKSQTKKSNPQVVLKINDTNIVLNNFYLHKISDFFGKKANIQFHFNKNLVSSMPVKITAKDSNKKIVVMPMRRLPDEQKEFPVIDLSNKDDNLKKAENNWQINLAHALGEM